VKEFLYFAGLLAVIALLLLFKGNNGKDNELRMELYNVPQASQEELVDMLNQNFESMRQEKQGSLARAEALSSGQIILFAPDSLHEGFRRLLSGLDTEPKPSTSKHALNYSVKLWVVAGTASGGIEDDYPSVLNKLVEELKTSKGYQSVRLQEEFNMVLGKNGYHKIDGLYQKIECQMKGSNEILQLVIWNRNGKHQDLQASIGINLEKMMVIGTNRGWRNDSAQAQAFASLPADTDILYILQIQEI